MARRSKAASRRERQKRRDRGPRRPVPPTPPVPRAETRSATEATATPLATEGRPPAPRPDPRTMQAGPSALGERARAEYHYVARELRSIGLLTALMLIALIGAWVVFRLAGIGAG